MSRLTALLLFVMLVAVLALTWYQSRRQFDQNVLEARSTIDAIILETQASP